MRMTKQTAYLSALLLFAGAAYASGEAQKRWERMNQIRQEKFDLILPEVMRENGVEMWITVNREGYEDPLTEDFGRGYVGSWGYYVFTDRGGDRIERAALGIGTYLVTARSLSRIVLDFSLLGHAAVLALLAAGGPAGEAPIADRAEPATIAQRSPGIVSGLSVAPTAQGAYTSTSRSHIASGSTTEAPNRSAAAWAASSSRSQSTSSEPASCRRRASGRPTSPTP